MKLQHMRKRTRSALKAKTGTMIFSDGFGRNHKRKCATVDKSLFGGHAVTTDDIRAWLAAVPRLDPDSPRSARYIAAYDVPAKIAAAKAAGTFWNTIAATHAPRGF